MADHDLFRECRRALGLSGARLAAILGLADGRSIRYWEADEHSIPGSVWLALHALMERAEHDALAARIYQGPMPAAARDYFPRAAAAGICLPPQCPPGETGLSD